QGEQGDQPEAGGRRDERERDGEAVRSAISLLQRRGLEAEVLIPLIRRLEGELGRERAHAIAAETIAEIARQQGRAVAEGLGRTDIEGFTHVKDSWGGAGGDLTIETLRQDDERLEFNVVRCRFAERYAQMGASDPGSVLSCSRALALPAGYSHALHLERTQTIMQGAAFCNFRYRRVSEQETEAPDEAPDEAGDEPAA